ncbi:histidine kinase [Actibacterium mucosum KCTC 23349]|uniref:histidine kinase n=1 Tax=Actibacterium mucosum KCTC 23349 TaxID=1454373 RepID=A0A037ZL93_9RHOB|nr:ActS/PrrB/RegB family redox-sensitive histidine kinase [Actibacterium mucosum]KAJ57221.1 histidine kinase [Actibacterium mucosum KCTC 23349]
MSEYIDLDGLSTEGRNQWIRLRTLTALRWVAIIGQTTAVAAGTLWLEYQIPLGWCSLVIGAAIIANLLSVAVYPENRRLSEGEATVFLLFDAAQLATLLALTGGLSNPFSLLVLTPVTISAAALRLLPTVFLGTATLAMVSAIAFWFVPLRDAAGVEQILPNVFTFGFWMAIVIGVVFLSIYASRITSELNSMTDALLATQMALGREQKLTDIGGVVAAAAHELGTPLATIKLVSNELAEELEDQPVLRDDAILIREQADRCRDILRGMGRAGKDEQNLHASPLSDIITFAAEPHGERGKELHFNLRPSDPGRADEPLIHRHPEVIHGLRNLVQNAVDFAQRNVWIEAHWSDDEIGMRISDDGPGYPPQELGRIGDPFLGRRRGESGRRPGYEGMGLGLFIAKTLLERTGAALDFANGSDLVDGRKGAIVSVTWPRHAIAVQDEDTETSVKKKFRI